MEIKSKKQFPTDKRMIVSQNKPYADLIKNYNEALKTSEGQNEELIAELEFINGLCPNGVSVKEYIGQLKKDVTRLTLEKETAEGTSKELNGKLSDMTKERDNALSDALKANTEKANAVSEKDRKITNLEGEISDLKEMRIDLIEENKELTNKQGAFKTKVIALMRDRASHNNPVKVLDNCITIITKSEF